MKKIIFAISIISLVTLSALALEEKLQTSFTQAIKTCENYTKEGSSIFEGEEFDITITLNKTKKGCIYNEKISQGKNYQALTCNFSERQLNFIHDSMERYSAFFKKEIAKKPIFEAKLTNNGEVFQKYLIDPEICKITYSKKKVTP